MKPLSALPRLWLLPVIVVVVAAGVYLIAKHRKLPGVEVTAKLDTRYFDTSTRPQDDFYRFVNGKWLDTVAIPTDKSRYGVFFEIIDNTEARLLKIISDLQSDKSIKPGTDAQRIRDTYASFMNEPRLEELGATPLQSTLTDIDAIHDATQLPIVMAKLSRQGNNMPMGLYVHPDNRDSTHYAPDIYQNGLDLPDRDYYLKDGEDGAYKSIRQSYEKHISAMFSLAGLPNADQSAKQILQLETEIAKAHWDKVSNRDPIKTYNKFAITELAKITPRFDWNDYLQTVGISGKTNFLLIEQPTYITKLSELVTDTPLDTWKLYLKWKVINNAAAFLSKAFVDEDFAFYGKVISGTPELRARNKRGLDIVEQAEGESLGKLYVSQYFSEQQKQRMLALVNNLLAAYRESINALDWMSPETKQQAQIKLSKLAVKIGYPDNWRDYSQLQITPDDLWGNVTRASEFSYQYNINKLDKPVDHTLWGMTPQTVNAYYNPELNEIVFPAAILQPPFFDMNADDATNYGAIGSVIGHEISHGFDDQGSQFDENGNLRDWWTAKDHEKFAAKTQALVDQYSAYESIPGYHLNGKLTLGENIADVSGAAIAFKAYRHSLNNQPAPIINGYSGEQRFFIGMATVWQEKSRDKEAIRLVTIDPHSPPRFRVLGSLSNMNAFYDAFNIKPGDKMYLPPEKRVSIW